MQRDLLVLIYFCSFSLFASDTALKLYRPFGEAEEQISPKVTKMVAGTCDVQSRLILREDAWRCRVEGRVFDPCFAKVVNRKVQVLCPKSPWVSDSLGIEVSSPLNNQQHVDLDVSRAYPWAVELTNGERCLAIETDEEYDAMPVRYRCENQSVLFGYLQRCKAVWSILEKTPEGVATVELSKAWF